MVRKSGAAVGRRQICSAFTGWRSCLPGLRQNYYYLDHNRYDHFIHGGICKFEDRVFGDECRVPRDSSEVEPDSALGSATHLHAASRDRDPDLHKLPRGHTAIQLHSYWHRLIVLTRDLSFTHLFFPWNRFREGLWPNLGKFNLLLKERNLML